MADKADNDVQQQYVRLVLLLDGLAVRASIQVTSTRLSVFELERLRSNGARRKAKGDAELLRLVRDRLSSHLDRSGVNPASNVKSDRDMLVQFCHARRTAAQLGCFGRGDKATIQQQSTFLLFDFEAGTCSCVVESDCMPSQWSDALNNVVRYNVVHVSLSGVAHGYSPHTSARGPVAPHGDQMLPAVGDAVSVRLDCTRSGCVRVCLRVCGRQALNFEDAAPKREPRAAASAGASSRCQLEHDLESELTRVEADEVARWEAWDSFVELRTAANEAAVALAGAESHVKRLEAKVLSLEKTSTSALTALETERNKRKAAQAQIIEVEEQAIADRRLQDQQLRSNNKATWESAASAKKEAARLSSTNTHLQKGSKDMRNALERERTNRKATDSLLIQEREQAIADRRMQDEHLRSANQQTIEKRAAAEKKAEKLMKESNRLAKGKELMRGAFDRERTNRKAAESLLFEEREQAIASLRRQDEQLRSNNALTLQSERVLRKGVALIQAQLERAKRMKKVQEMERLEAELDEARTKLARVNSENASLRQSTSAKEATRLKEQLRASQANTKEAEERAHHHATHAEALQEELQEELEAAEVLSRRAAKAHAMALQRGRQARAEVKALQVEGCLKDATLEKLAFQLAQREVALLEREAAADARLDEVCARLQAGDARTRQMQQELEALQAQLEADARHAASKHAIVEEQLRCSEAALAAYYSFQAKEGGAYKDSVRLCYYSLIDRKVPTNQLEAVVTEVLKMVGVRARALPSRGTAQNMRREMGHVADTVAGVLLAKAQNVTGASDDTTKRQRTLAADLAHFRLADGSLRTICIGLSCMSSSTAVAKLDRFCDKMAQVQAAARLSLPDFYGDVAAFDRVTLLDLVKNWCSDRCITERNVAKLVEERKGKEARAREGARQLAGLRVIGCTLQLKVCVRASGVYVGGVVALREDRKPPPVDVAQLAELETSARRAVAASMEATLPHESEQQLVDAEMARRLGAEWWGGLTPSEQHAISHVWAATCNAHRWVNVGKGFDEGIKEAFDAIKAEQHGEATTTRAGTTKGGSPWDSLIYELTKMLCMNARKMNVAIGQDFLGQQVIELGKDPEACIHTRLKVIVGERFLVTYTNAVPAVALESELLPEAERLSALMELRRVRKTGDRTHNRLEASVLEHYKDADEYDALRVKAVVGHYLLHPLYLSTYHINHVLELNEYVVWVIALLDQLIADPSRLLAGEVHALQFWHLPLQHEPLLAHALHTPAWGNASFLRMLKAGLEHARTWTVRHSAEHLSGGALDYKSLNAALAAEMWCELESHPIDNLAAERTLALDCYLTKVLGTRLRVIAREAMAKWAMNVKLKGGHTELDDWSKEQVHSTLRDSMRKGRQKIETERQEAARLHEERLPALRAAEQQFRVAEEKKAVVHAAFARMRAEGREVRCVGAISLLLAKEVQVQLALRWCLDGLAVKRSGKDEMLRPLLEAQVAKEVAACRAAGGEEPSTAEAEIARLKALGFGRKAQAARTRRAPSADGAAPRRQRQRVVMTTGESGSSSGEGSDESESDSDEVDGIDIKELLNKDDDVFEVEKLLEWRAAADGGREILVKWKGFSTKETTWEPEGNILEKRMIKEVLKKPAFGEQAKAKQGAPRAATVPPTVEQPEPQPEPTRARSSRASAKVASEAARRDNKRDAEADVSEESDEDDAPVAPAPAAAARGKQRRRCWRPGQPDSSDEEGSRKRVAVPAPAPAARGKPIKATPAPAPAAAAPNGKRKCKSK